MSEAQNRIAKARKFSVRHDDSLLNAIKKMEAVERKLLLVFEADRYLGLVSIGDIQRKLIKSFDLSVPVHTVMRQKQKVAESGDSADTIKSRIFELRAEMMPVLDEHKNLADIYLWEDFFPDLTRIRPADPLNVPVVIMAGGEGRRLRPITNVIPKALVPIGERPIIEEIIHRFNLLGANQFLVSLNYKGDFIQQYFADRPNKKYQIEYFKETEPLGTAGGLGLLRKKLSSTFFVSNCDILVEEDYTQIFNYHKDSKNQLTIVGVMKNLSIPYGTLEVGNGGILKSMQEKPDFNFIFNSGMYLMEPKVLELIPPNTMFHATDLIKSAQEVGMRVGVFPVNEGSWQDIGEWSTYVEKVALSQLRSPR